MPLSNANGEVHRRCPKHVMVTSGVRSRLLMRKALMRILVTVGTASSLDRHLKRLRRSASLMSLVVPLSDRELAARIAATVKQASGECAAEWYIWALLTRGIGDLSYVRRTRIRLSSSLSEPLDVLPNEVYAEGVRAIISSVVVNHPETVNPAIKGNNLINNALAMQEAIAHGAFEAIMRTIVARSRSARQRICSSSGTAPSTPCC